MNRDIDSRDLDYRAMDPPWGFANYNIYERIFQLHDVMNETERYIEVLTSFRDSKIDPSSEVSQDQIREAKTAILRLMKTTDVIKWNFPEIIYEAWFSSFTSDLAHAYWRTEDGRFNNASNDESQFRSLAGEVERICGNLSESRQTGFYTRLSQYIERLDWDLQSSAPDEFKDEAREAADLFCLGYYSTALIVLGRAVERSLLKLGETRQIQSVRAYDQEIPWRETKFYHKNTALNRADMPNRKGNVLSERQFHEISILVDYRNNVAHAEYADIQRGKALRQCQSAFDLLTELEEIRDTLCEFQEEEIEPITQQKVQ